MFVREAIETNPAGAGSSSFVRFSIESDAGGPDVGASRI
jgi:hypothetical protein